MDRNSQLVDDDILIEIAPWEDPLLEPKDVKPAPKREAKKEPKEPTASLADLEAARAQARQETQAREAAQAEAREARAQAEANRTALTRTEVDLHQRTVQGFAAHHRSVATELQQVISGIEHAKTVQATAKREIEQALADDNLTSADRARRVADAQERMSTAAADLGQLESGRHALDSEVRRAERAWRDAHAAAPVHEPEREQPVTKPAVATPEQFITNAPPETQTWLRSHPEYATPGTKAHRQMMRFADQWLEEHDDKVESVNSQAFVDAMNQKFFPKAAKEEEEEEVAEDETPEEVEAVAKTEAAPKRLATAAPVSRSSSPTRQSSGINSIQLTQEQFALAPDLYPSFEDLDPAIQTKFKVWTPSAARVQYHTDLKRTQKDGKRVR